MHPECSVHSTRIISGNFNHSESLFANTNGDLYVDHGNDDGQVKKWTKNATIGRPVMNVATSCDGLFVTINDSIYCSHQSKHIVVMASFSESTTTTVAGTGIAGLGFDQLYKPIGLFVHTNLSLYVADCFNHRIQRFGPGQNVGVSVASSDLSYPTGVLLDAEDYLFIVDQGNHRIVRYDSHGVRCLVGCSKRGSAPDQLSWPWTMFFDSYGNMFVGDPVNNRIQEFILDINPCRKFHSSTCIVKGNIFSDSYVSMTRSTCSLKYHFPY